MGASESTEVQVTFNHPDMFYYSGDIISGDIKLHSTYEKLNLDGIFLQFVGEIGFTSQETRTRYDSNGRNRPESYTEYHRTPFITLCVPVAQPQGGQRELTLYRGQHSWQFEFRLPDCLPPSTLPPTHEFPYVKYVIRSLVDKTRHKSNSKQIYPVTIFPRVNIYQLPQAIQASHFSESGRKKVTLCGSLVQTGVIPGDNLVLQLSLENPKRREIKRIEAILYQQRNIAQNAHTEIIFRMDLPALREFSDKHLQQTFNLQVPASMYLAPSYRYDSQCCTPSFSIDFHYELHLEVKVRGIFTDFKVKVPVIIGTPTGSEQALAMSASSTLIVPSAPAYDFDDLPPAYESVVANMKA